LLEIGQHEHRKCIIFMMIAYLKGYSSNKAHRRKNIRQFFWESAPKEKYKTVFLGTVYVNMFLSLLFQIISSDLKLARRSIFFVCDIELLNFLHKNRGPAFESQKMKKKPI
jgi:hypothetical protein